MDRRNSRPTTEKKLKLTKKARVAMPPVRTALRGGNVLDVGKIEAAVQTALVPCIVEALVDNFPRDDLKDEKGIRDIIKKMMKAAIKNIDKSEDIVQQAPSNPKLQQETNKYGSATVSGGALRKSLPK